MPEVEKVRRSVVFLNKAKITNFHILVKPSQIYFIWSTLVKRQSAVGYAESPSADRFQKFRKNGKQCNFFPPMVCALPPRIQAWRVKNSFMYSFILPTIKKFLTCFQLGIKVAAF